MLNIYKTDSKSGFLKITGQNLHRWTCTDVHNYYITVIYVPHFLCLNVVTVTVTEKTFILESQLIPAFSFFLKQSLRATPRICNDLEVVFNTTVCGLSLPVYGSRSSVSHTASRCPPNRQNQVSQTQNWNFRFSNRRLLCRNSHLWIRYNVFVISSHKNTTIECSFHVCVTTAANRYYCPT